MSHEKRASPRDTAVGLDLGTTNTVLAFTRPAEALARVFPVPQRVTRDTIEALALLPSCLYAPLPGELPGDPSFVVGRFAKGRGAEVPQRAVTSAKSWLCHAAVDRRAAILPFGLDVEGAETPKLSPVEASRRVLEHVQSAWNASHADAPLAEVTLALTVPASFDDDARELTRMAAEQAGLSVRLLEEPVAAVYDFLGRDDAEATLRELGEGALVLVCDVGGGTTDLSLVRITDTERAAPTLTRVASGRHILLGGDNMDLALAYALEERFVQRGERLPPARFAELTAACREAKEQLFSSDLDSVNVTLLGHGSKLVGGSRTTPLSRELAREVVVGGFFPTAPPGARAAARPAALRGLGLPYERDPAITRHVATFLARVAAAEGTGAARPRAVLLNGGVFRAPHLAQAFLASLAESFDHGASRGPRLLPNPEPELAVARGAATYARLLARGEGARVRGGSARSYFIGLGDPGAPKAVCVVPRGAEEGARHAAPERRFSLALGQRARFALYASDVDRSAPGDVVALDDERFFPLPPLVARLGEPLERGAAEVSLEGEVSQIGTLELGCVTETGRRFRLAFRLEPQDSASVAPPAPSPTIAPPTEKVHSALVIAQVDARVAAVFGKRSEATPREVKDLPRELERLLGEKGTWRAETARALADRLLEAPGSRRRSADHERVWFQLVGHCLRPGRGAHGDPERVEALARTWEGRLAFPDEARGWAAFFVAFRRTASGLPAPVQESIAELAAQVLAPREVGLKRPKRLPEAQDELLSLAASLERVPPRARAALGEWLFDRVRAKDDARVWEGLGRLGARVPSYGPAHEVLPAGLVEVWLERLLRAEWGRDARFARAAALLARRTDDRARDVSPRLRELTIARLDSAGAPEVWRHLVAEVVVPEAYPEGEASLFDDELPPGLTLAGNG
ncbi:MAG: Hsp70 family protein [Myxococcales bacterium]|nr:Hsp70 family protein [Myxococcales bacterium]MBL0195177.1 Hsp70 family protein [Myxococcales bacterium]HQY60177.1 Hsp70 family protein [Polyangiaceae bacterium]